MGTPSAACVLCKRPFLPPDTEHNALDSPVKRYLKNPHCENCHLYLQAHKSLAQQSPDEVQAFVAAVGQEHFRRRVCQHGESGLGSEAAGSSGTLNVTPPSKRRFESPNVGPGDMTPEPPALPSKRHRQLEVAQIRIDFPASDAKEEDEAVQASVNHDIVPKSEQQGQESAAVESPSHDDENDDGYSIPVEDQVDSEADTEDPYVDPFNGFSDAMEMLSALPEGVDAIVDAYHEASMEFVGRVEAYEHGITTQLPQPWLEFLTDFLAELGYSRAQTDSHVASFINPGN